MQLQINLLPPRIRAAVEGRDSQRATIGRSGSKVWVFDDRVLKIERTGPTADREYELLNWLDGRVGAPRVIDFEREEDNNYLVETRVPGIMTCDQDALADPAAVTHALAQGLIALREIPAEGCPFDSRLELQLAGARDRFKCGQIHQSDLSDEFLEKILNMPTPRLRRDARGTEDFPSIASVLNWLERGRPAETPVFVHGDYCLPNVFLKAGRFSGMLDFGRGGIADVYMDIALCVRSMWYNFCFLGGMTRQEFMKFRTMLFEELEMQPDEKRIRYYVYLDELS